MIVPSNQSRHFFLDAEAQRVAIVGIGGCGTNMVNGFVTSKQTDYHTINADTDSLVLRSSTADESFPLFDNGTPACGLRGDMQVGSETAMCFRKEFLRRISRYDTVILCAGLGGGTGSGITGVFAKAAMKKELNVLCFCTLPFHFEGEKRRRIASIALNELQSHGIWIEVFDNQKLFRYVPKGSVFGDAFEVVNRHFLSLLHNAAVNGFDRQFLTSQNEMRLN